MKINDGFMLRNVGGENVVVAIGEASDHFHGMIRLNESAAFLWKKLKDGADTKDKLIDALISEYGIDRDRAEKGVNSFIDTLEKNKVLVNG